MLILYQNQQGEVLAHQPKNPKDDGVYLRGYCELAKGLRTWRKDRIISEFSDQAALDAYISSNSIEVMTAVVQETRKANRARLNPDQIFEICFTGFAAKERAELEGLAIANAMLVKKDVTSNLDLLCTGERAGPAKMIKAEKQGTCLITVDEFKELITNGVMPQGWMQSGVKE